MKLLLDTHAFLWFVAGDEKLSPAARTSIEQGETRILSVASLWEMAIKASIGKLRLDLPFEELVERHVRPNGIELLGIEIRHVSRVAALPFLHRDPFDRLLVAQALGEGLVVVSADESFDAYGVARVW
ncbi:MAG: type II toxin-antitoxin system VapC family toxin [Deltaproteobacteria bacterium]|nr:type II toxin-antitoxin system VapC family toxin [Deltaproteobacteria bacterium]